MVMKGGRAAEVLPLDQRDVQASGRAVPRGHQAVDAAPDDKQVEGVRGEGVEIAEHG